MKKNIALFVGDRYGVGPELVARYVSQLGPDCLSNIIVFGDKQVLERGAVSAGVKLTMAEIAAIEAAGNSPWAILDSGFGAKIGPMGQVSETAGREALAALTDMSNAVSNGYIDGIVYAPLNKQAMKLAGHSAGDELDFFTSYFKPDGLTGEINILGDLWTSRVTSHVPLSKVAEFINSESVGQGIMLLAEALQSSGKSNPKLVVAALNPHAGEGGAYGREEIDILAPAIVTARQSGIDVIGPLPSDTIFPRVASEGIDGVVTMYHDQGQIALKLMGLGKGVTLLAGLPVPIATPGHGTAFDIAGQGIARIEGLQAAIKLVFEMVEGS